MKRILGNDLFGMGVSILCILHCMAMPILVSLFPHIFPHHSHGSLLELTFLALILMAFVAFIRGYKIHHSKQALVLAIIGLSLLVTSLWLHESKLYISTIGGIFILSAHFWNFRLCKCTAHNHHH